MYVAVKGGETAIDNAHAWLAEERRGDVAVADLSVDQIREQLDLKVFVDAKESLKIIRRIKRDRIERNYPLDDVLYRYEHHVMPAFEQFIKPFAPTADIVVNNNSVFEKGLQMVKGFIRNYLDELNREGGITYRLREE